LELLEKFREIDYQLAMETKRTIVKRPTLKSDEQVALEKLSRLTKEELQALIDAINLKRKGSNL
jgi:methylase of polypeptide subunit release factors